MSLHYTLSAVANTVERPVGGTLAPVAFARGGSYRRGLKRILDLVLICLTAPVTVPFIAIIALMVWADGGKPFYRQQRVGRHGRMFTIWKIRTMVPEAEARLEAHLAGNPAAKAEWQHVQKLRDDPRVTALGGYLRASSVDEIPQFWNVLKGEMSLVGPRPMMPEQEPLYPHNQAYYALRPGVTGFWQIAERNNTSFSARADFDSDYDRQLSLLTDLRVLLRTCLVVWKRTGC
jgi:exopolysaccharide production protein ExoY